MIDLDFVRRQFPAFAAPSLKEHSFFENAGGSYMCQHVIDRFNRYFEQRKVQPYYAFEASKIAGEEMDLAPIRFARYLNVNARRGFVWPFNFTKHICAGARVP